MSFQLEGPGMRQLLCQIKPDRMEDLIALVALYRPGPMDSIPNYIACKHGSKQPSYLHPLLKPILKETYGIMTYQEDVIRIARELAGYSLGQADLLRRAMGKKDPQEMKRQKQRFMDGCLQNHIPKKTAKKIFDQANKFAGYGFNKGHAVAYALVAYQTAYLKAHYPVEFMAASMSLDYDQTSLLSRSYDELRRLNIVLLPPDINRSSVDFTVEQRPDEDYAIRYALSAIKGIGKSAILTLVEERRINGEFKSLSDLIHRVDMQKTHLEALCKAGAFDALTTNRAQIFEELQNLCTATRPNNTMISLFEEEETQLPHIADWPPQQRLKYERDVLGFYLSSHPFDTYRALFKSFKLFSFSEVSLGETSLQLAGILKQQHKRTTKNGDTFWIWSLSDEHETFEVRLFSDVLSKDLPPPELYDMMVVTVRVNDYQNSITLTCSDFCGFNDFVAQNIGQLEIRVCDVAVVEELSRLLAGLQEGKSRVILLIPIDSEAEIEISLPQTYRITAR